MRIIIFLLGTFFWLALFQMEAIPIDETVTVVLRAPTSKEPQLVVKPAEAEVDNSRRGLTVSLPINTPVFFYIDQVNTALYTVEIKVTEEQPEVAKLPEFKNLSISTILNVIDTLLNLAQKQGLVEEQREGLETLKTKVEAVDQLNKALDALLYKTEDPKFYTTEGINNYFKQIQFKAAESTQKMLKCLEKDKSEENKSKLLHGRSQEIYNAAGPVFKKIS